MVRENSQKKMDFTTSDLTYVEEPCFLVLLEKVQS